MREEWRFAVLKVVESAYWHTFLCLTKQIQNVGEERLPENFWLGVSVNRKDELWRLNMLKNLRFKAVARRVFVSFEPLMEDLGETDFKGVDWIIVGAQTSPKTQPKKEWVDNIIWQAEALGIPVFVKNNLEGYRIQQYPIFMWKSGAE